MVPVKVVGGSGSFGDKIEMVVNTQREYAVFQALNPTFVRKGNYSGIVRCLDNTTIDMVPVKVVGGSLGDRFEMIVKTQREYTILRSLNHPRIIRAIALDLHPHYSSIIMSYMAYDLGKCIRELGNAMSKSLIKVLLAQAIQALSYIHGCDLVHDNLRPEHLFVDLENINITIGGLSHAHSPNFARLHGSYDPLEIWGRAEFTPASDVWSLGAIFAQVLTGRHFPYAHEELLNQQEVLFVNIDGQGRDLLNRMLQLVPLQRITMVPVKVVRGSGSLGGRIEMAVLLAQAIQTLSYIHGCDLVHGNLRPGHLFVDLENINITIGGLSHAHSPNFARLHGSYDPLEIWGRAECTPASDVWSLGAIFAQVLTGRHFPYAHEELLNQQEVLFVNIDGQGRDLLNRMLQLVPLQRITLGETLGHPFFNDVPANHMLLPLIP
ncbi:cyclin-dependent kinase 3-like [Salvia hispanica]|uniref:cyclin-dependent kinase 3-like n=1 Tax=Salvia hispanica TaxID=49212 RepID=UPI0020094C3D|nr:cyclin-dependent kinase 3-like [Salvia hispanica]